MELDACHGIMSMGCNGLFIRWDYSDQTNRDVMLFLTVDHSC